MLFLAIASACTAAGGEAEKPDNQPKVDSGTPEQPETPPVAATTTKITVASVQMIQDCPDPEPEPAPADAPSAERAAPMPAQPAPGAVARSQPHQAGDVAPGDSFRQPCDQSTVQLALETDGDAPVTVEIKAVRILSKGKAVGELASRKPTLWRDNGYQPWDQTVAPGTPVKASYKLSMPSWSEVEQAIGTSSFGHMFTLEIDVAVDGQLQTVSSPEFPREEPHVIVT